MLMVVAPREEGSKMDLRPPATDEYPPPRVCYQSASILMLPVHSSLDNVVMICFLKRKKERKAVCAALARGVPSSELFASSYEKKPTPRRDLESLTPSLLFSSPRFFNKKQQKQVKHDENEHRTGVARAGRDSEPLSWNDFLTL